MWGREVAIGIALSAVVLPGSSLAQQLVWRDRDDFSLLKIPGDTGQSFVRLKITQQLEAALNLSGAFFINWEHDPNTNQVLLMHDLVYHCKIERTKSFHFSQKVVQHLGFQYFLDSISRIHIDDNQVETKMEWWIRKNHGCFISSLFSTRIFNSYRLVVNDSGALTRSLTASFLTPLNGLFSGGIQFKWPLFGSLNLGITSAKLTWIRDRSIYELLGTNVFYGVPEEKRYLFEYGLSLHLLINYDIRRWLHWDCDLLIFKNTNLPPDISIRNNLGFRLTKFIKARIQTRIYYEEQITKRVQLENMISVGFVVSM